MIAMATLTPKMNQLTPSGAWFDAPAEKTPLFFPVYRRVARALMKSLRQEIPALYFQDLSRFNKHVNAYAMLVYGGSRPFRWKQGKDMSYDVLNEKSMSDMYRFAHRNLKARLTEYHPFLAAASPHVVAQPDRYSPRRSRRILRVTRSKVRISRLVNNMLMREGELLRELIALGSGATLPPKARAKKVVRFNRRWSMLLRRFFGRNDFTPAAPRLLDAATAALVRAQAHYQEQASATAA